MNFSFALIFAIVGVLILGTLGFNQEAFAADVTFVGGTGDWELGANWSGGSVPLVNDNAIIPTGSIVTINSPISIGNIGGVLIESGAELIIDGSSGSAQLNSDNIINNGIITTFGGPFSNTGIIRVNGGSLNNMGIINLNGGDVLFSGYILNNFGATLINSGIINIDSKAGINNNNIFVASLMINECDGIINNHGIFSNASTFINFGLFNNFGTYSGIPPVDRSDECTQPVETDIKPGSYPNAIQPMQMGVTAVVILSSSTFSAEIVDFSTITFGPDESTPVHKKPHLEDVNNDGLDDMVVHFKTKEIGIEQDTVELCLMAKTLDGTSIEGCDSIMVVPKV